MDEKYLQALYQQGQAGFDLGTYDEFKANITSDANFRKAFYDSAQDLDLGEYSAFETQIGAKKKIRTFLPPSLQRPTRSRSSLLSKLETGLERMLALAGLVLSTKRNYSRRILFKGLINLKRT